MKKKAKKTTKRNKLVTAASLQKLRNLSEQLGAIIPATSINKNGFCFRTIAKDFKLAKHWKDKGVKKESIFSFIKIVYKDHPIVFKKIIRESLPKAIERRRQNGDPLLRAEADALSQVLADLGVDLRKEIDDLELPTDRPSIVPPKKEVQRALDLLSLHPILLPECASLFKDGHLNESVRKALEKYEALVQQMSGLTYIGNNLMDNAFHQDAPKISVSSDSDEKRRRGIQEGFRNLSMGSMGYWRNYCSHKDEEQMPPQDALSILGTVSHLMYQIRKK